MIASSRQIASSMKVNSILDLSSGILKQLLNVLAMAASMALRKSEVRNLKPERSPKSEAQYLNQTQRLKVALCRNGFGHGLLLFGGLSFRRSS